MNPWIPATQPPPADQHVLLKFDEGLCPVAVGYYDNTWFEIHGDDCVAVDAPPTSWTPIP